MNLSSDHTQVILSLGANLGDRAGQLSTAIAALKLIRYVEVTAESSVYETPPLGVGPEHGPYLNQVVVVETIVSALELLTACRKIEKQIGRPTERNSMLPRLIDIDMISYGRQVSADATLIIPHPRYADRLFVLVPLAEVCPTYRDSQTGLTIDELLAACADDSVIHRIANDEVGA